MREGTNERTYTTTKHITTLLLRSRVKKSPHWRNSDEMLAMKNRFAETTNNDLHTIRVLPTFCRFFGVSSLFANRA